MSSTTFNYRTVEEVRRQRGGPFLRTSSDRPLGATKTTVRLATLCRRGNTTCTCEDGARIEVRDVDDEGNCLLVGYIDAEMIAPEKDDEDEDEGHDHELDGDNERVAGAIW